MLPHDGICCAVCEAGGALVYRNGSILCYPCRDDIVAGNMVPPNRGSEVEPCVVGGSWGASLR